MADFNIRRTDRLPAIECELLEDGESADLTGATLVELHYKPKRGGGAKVVKVGEIVAANPAKVRYAWAAGDTDVAGVYAAYWRVVHSGGRPATYPNQGTFEIAITEEL